MAQARRGRPPGPPRPLETPAAAAARRARAMASYYAMDPVRAWARAAIATAQRRARAAGIAFAITAADLREAAGTHCPALGTPLDYSRGRMTIRDDSATVDRLVPGLGYVPGNIAVISNKANVAKGRCSPEEIFAVGRWHGKQLNKRTSEATYG